jgi:hypothetical protein
MRIGLLCVLFFLTRTIVSTNIVSSTEDDIIKKVQDRNKLKRLSEYEFSGNISAFLSSTGDDDCRKKCQDIVSNYTKSATNKVIILYAGFII